MVAVGPSERRLLGQRAHSTEAALQETTEAGEPVSLSRVIMESRSRRPRRASIWR